MDMDGLPVVVVDVGSTEWRVGWADDDGPSVVVPAPTNAAGFVSNCLHSLEGFDEANACTVLLSEPPDQTSARRDAAARLLFAHPTVQALCCMPSPLLSVYAAEFDTGVLVEVGWARTFVFALYEGRPVLDGVTCHALAGRHAGDTADAPCDVLFGQPPPEAGAEAGAQAGAQAGAHGGAGSAGSGVEACGVDGAILRTLALIDDASIRARLLCHVAVVGGGSLLPGFASRLEEELQRAALAAGVRVRVRAHNARRLAPWLGGAALSQLGALSSRFCARAAFAASPTHLHELCALLPCRTVGDSTLTATLTLTAQQ
jgi:actin-related protein